MPDSFSPAWTSPPGDSIADALEELGWTSAAFAERLGVSTRFVSELLHGKAPITADTARGLSLVLGSTPQFWLTREAQYRAALTARPAAETAEVMMAWLKELPVRWMERQRLIPASPRGTPATRQVDACLRYFGVASIDAWRSTYSAPIAAWRASKRQPKTPGAVACWIRAAELAAEAISCARWDEDGFKAALPNLRALTLEPDPQVFVPRMQELCASYGVAVVFVPAPPGCPISGATKWLAPDKALLALSLRYGNDDHLWFSFFHEVGHLVRHGKKLLFLEGLDGVEPEQEREADTFAKNLLIPAAAARKLQHLRAADDVVAAAASLGVSPGVLVGRMQHEAWIPFSELNGLKVRYAWSDGGADETED